MSPMNNRLLVPRKTPGLLDLVPGAAAAYSLRSLSNSYAGPVVTVRRSSDDAEEDFTASEVSDGTLAAFCGGGDGFVKQWWDQSPNANHASQSSSGSQPQICDSGSLIISEGKPALSFALDFLAAASTWGISGTSDRSFFSVVEPGNLVTGYYYLGIGDNSATSSSQNWNLTSEHGIRVQGGNELYGGGVVGEQQLAVHVFSGSTPADNSFFLNGAALPASGSTSSISTVDTVCRIGRFGGSSSTPDAHYAGKLQEIVIYASDLTSQRELVEGLIAWGYSV